MNAIKNRDYEHTPMPKLPYCIDKENFKVRLIQSTDEVGDKKDELAEKYTS